MIGKSKSTNGRWSACRIIKEENENSGVNPMSRGWSERSVEESTVLMDLEIGREKDQLNSWMVRSSMTKEFNKC